MDHFYGNQIPKISLGHIIQQTEDIIKMKQICKEFLPAQCNAQANSLLVQNLQSIGKNVSPSQKIDCRNTKIQNIKLDSMTPLKLKIQKKEAQFCQARPTSHNKSFRKSSAVNQNRDLCTASTNNRVRKSFNKTFDGSFAQQLPIARTQNLRRVAKTAESSSRKKYFELKKQPFVQNHEDETKRKELKDKRYLNKIEEQTKQKALFKLSYQKRALQQELQTAKRGTNGFSLGKNKQINQIVNYQIENGRILTNRLKKPYRKTIENIINIQFQDQVKQRILRRKTQRQFQIGKNSKNLKQNSQDEQQKFALINKNYNNSGRRQISFIPYMTINPGVCLSERSIQATISRARPQQNLSRENFFKTLQNKTFRSYSYSRQNSPEKRAQQKPLSIDVGRQNRASKTSLNNQTKDSLRKSLLWGPQAARQGSRIKVVKEVFMRQLTNEQL